MKTHRFSTRMFISAVLIVSILLTGFVIPISARSRPIVITCEQPKTFVNPKNLSIISASVVNFVPQEASQAPKEKR